MIGILLMSGKGKRFSDVGYKTPKPLISVFGKPMFINSLNSFPKFEKLYLVTTDIVSNNKMFIDSLDEIKTDYEVISLKETTSGQAESCYLAAKYIENNKPFFVGPCDFELKSQINLDSLFLNNEEIIIVTYTPKQINLDFPNNYGWVESDRGSLVKKIEVKSNSSINKENSKIISGIFLFKNKEIFENYFKIMKVKKIKVNNEYYLDSLCKIALEEGSKVVYLNTHEGVSYGTPQEVTFLDD